MAEQATINLNVKTDESQKSLRAMRQELKQLQIAMDNAADPAEFKRLAAEFAELRNDIADTSEAMKYLDPGELLSGWTKFAQGAVGAFSAITGAMSLFGSESEAIQEIEKKSMVLIQTMMGLEQARQLLVDQGGKAQFRQLVETTRAQITYALSIKTVNAATGEAVVVQNLWNKAMKSAPVFLLITAVAGLTVGLAALYKASRRQRSEQEVLNGLMKSASDDIGKNAAVLEAHVARLKSSYGNQKEYNAAVKDWNENIAGKYSNTLLTASSDLDDVSRAASEARANIIKMGIAAAAQEKISEIYSDNLDYILAYQSALDKATVMQQKAADIDAAIKEKMAKDAKFATTEEFRQLASQSQVYKDTAENLKTYGQIQSETMSAAMVKGKGAYDQVQQLLDIVDKYTVAIEDNTGAAEDNADKTVEKTKETVEEIFRIYTSSAEKWKTAFVDGRLTTVPFIDGITKSLGELRNEWTDAYNDVRAKSLSRALEGADWEKAKAALLDYYGQGIIGEEEYNAAVIKYAEENAAANEEAYDQGLITVEEYEKNKTAITKAESEKRLAALEKEFSAWTGFANSAASSMGDVFSNLTELMTMELDAQDKAWQESYEARSTALGDELEKAKQVWGEESEQYKYLLKQQQDAADAKADHDADMEKKRKAAENKYKKGSIATDMVKATSDLAMASFGIWAGETSTKGLMGIPVAIALQAMLAAAYVTQMAVMSKQMSLVGKMRLGGPVFGPSHESGGVDRNLEGGEFVINAQSMKVPGVAQLANSLNRTGQGGSAPVMAALPDESIERIVGAIAAIPVVVSERDITGTQRRVAVIESKTTF